MYIYIYIGLRVIPKPVNPHALFVCTVMDLHLLVHQITDTLVKYSPILLLLSVKLLRSSTRTTHLSHY